MGVEEADPEAPEAPSAAHVAAQIDRRVAQVELDARVAARSDTEVAAQKLIAAEERRRRLSGKSRASVGVAIGLVDTDSLDAAEARRLSKTEIISDEEAERNLTEARVAYEKRVKDFQEADVSSRMAIGMYVSNTGNRGLISTDSDVLTEELSLIKKQTETAVAVIVAETALDDLNAAIPVDRAKVEVALRDCIDAYDANGIAMYELDNFVRPMNDGYRDTVIGAAKRVGETQIAMANAKKALASAERAWRARSWATGGTVP
jgi:hypothetical protein